MLYVFMLHEIYKYVSNNTLDKKLKLLGHIVKVCFAFCLLNQNQIDLNLDTDIPIDQSDEFVLR